MGSSLSITAVVLYAMVIVVGLLLVGLVLIQPSKSGGLGSSFGGVGESVFGAHAGSHLTKMTVILSSVFFLLVLILAVLVSHGGAVNQEKSGVDELLSGGQVQSAAPAAEAPAGK